MADDRQPMAKKVGAVVADDEDPISGPVMMAALDFLGQVSLTLGIPPGHLSTLDHVAFRGLPPEGWTVPRQTATQISALTEKMTRPTSSKTGKHVLDSVQRTVVMREKFNRTPKALSVSPMEPVHQSPKSCSTVERD